LGKSYEKLIIGVENSISESVSVVGKGFDETIMMLSPRPLSLSVRLAVAVCKSFYCCLLLPVAVTVEGNTPVHFKWIT
jgi:hypothetical protein